MSSNVLHVEEQTDCAAGSSNPLFDPLVLQNVLSYVGVGHHLFVAPISKLWHAIYATLQSQQLTACSRDRRRNIVITCVPQTTLYSSVFTSPSRVRLAHESGLPCTSTAYRCAAGKYADSATLAAAHELGMPYTVVTITDAAENNRLAEVQYLHSQGCPWPSGLLDAVASRGFYELMRWCYEHGCPCDASMAPNFAARSGSVELLAWVLQQPGTLLHGDVMRAAASYGHTEVCRFLRSQQCPWSAQSTFDAVHGGHVDVLTWLVDNGCPWDAQELRQCAASSGSVKVLAYLQQQGELASTPLLTDMLNIAARNNKLAAAKWLRDQGAEWPAAFGWPRWSAAVLAWARAEGCTTPFN
eukprot:6701-Heterococcus_DN1.PRE.1